MRRMFLFGVCASIISPSFLQGQGITLAGTGYTDPSIIRVAPGQITTLFVTGLKTVLSSQPVNATMIPLPIALAGITVTLNQTNALPLLSIQQMSVCSSSGAPPPPAPPLLSSPDCLITAITLQVPFELPLPGDRPNTGDELAVSENGNVSKTFRVLPITDNLHIINTCDVFPSPKVIRAGSPSTTSYAAICAPLATHGNGDLITADDPAQGERKL